MNMADLETQLQAADEAGAKVKLIATGRCGCECGCGGGGRGSGKKGMKGVQALCLCR